jgi:AAA domain
MAERDYDAKAEDLNGKDTPEVRIRCGFEILEAPMVARWLLRPYLEEGVLALLYGDLGTLKSFIALDWVLRLATAGIPGLYMSAEGRGLDRRIRGWCQRHYPDKTAQETMADALFYAVEHPLPLTQLEAMMALEEAIASKAIPPKLIVVDTLARYGGAMDENSARDIGVLIAAADRLRMAYGATVLFVHHVGHSAKDRARGSYALMAATDAHFLVERPGPSERLRKPPSLLSAGRGGGSRLSG